MMVLEDKYMTNGSSLFSLLYLCHNQVHNQLIHHILTIVDIMAGTLIVKSKQI